MTTSNQITLDHIKNYFSLDGHLELLNIAPTATGGTGINNLEEFPPPKPCISVVKAKDTNYVKKYLSKAQAEMERKAASSVSLGSTFSVNNFEDVEELSTAAGDLPQVSDLDIEKTKQIYSTYYSVPNKVYDADLNVTHHRERILQLLNINPVVIIEGPTGCGKTTQVPQYILDYHAKNGKYCNIIVTQPRKIAAISIAKRVCQERGWQLGTLVGYQVAMDPKVSADTRLCYVTTGVLLEKLVSAKSMDKFTHVIIDEVHERDQDIDFALLLVKKFLMTNSGNVKVVLMSATFDTSMFAEYFSLSLKGDPAPIIEISGKTKEVTEHYLHELKTLLPNQVVPEFDLYVPCIDPSLYETIIQLMYVFDRIEKAEQNVAAETDYAPSRGAVLIFLPGYDEISMLSDKLTMARFNKKFWVIPLHSMITLAEQSKVFMNPPPDHRKVIISTNIAESSITVPDIKYVIDFCLTKSIITDPQTNYTSLHLEWASKANCIQRKGRAGRVDIGKVYRMVPKYFYEQFADYSTPEIKRCPLTSTILSLKRLDVCEPQEMLAFALDPPYSIDIENAVLQLKEALALYGKGSNHDGDLTFIGNVMASLPLDIKLSKLILFGYAFSCLEECIVIAASLSLQSFFARPFQKALESYRSRLSWADYTFSDCFAYLNAYKVWKHHSAQSFFLKPGGMKEKEWGERHYIQIKRIKEVDMLVKELKSRLEKHNIYVDNHQRSNTDNPDSDMILKIVIAGAFFPHYFLQDRLDEVEIMREVNDNDPLSTVVVAGLPPNHGLLYACALKDMFTCCSDKIDIDFEERKAYIKFERYDASSKAEELKLPSLSVQPAVYLAVKMRLLRMPMELSVFSHYEAESKMQQIRQLKSANSSMMLATNRYSVRLKPASTLQKIDLPTPETLMLSIFITHLNNCGHFWARYMTAESSKHLRFIEYTIFNYQKEKGLQPLRKRPDLNMLCLAPYHETREGPVQYYRAQVRDVRNRMVKVHFVDYGNEDIIKEDDLREICESLPDVINTPALALECLLSEIKPSSSHHHLGVWTDEANAWFKRTVSGKVVKAKVYSVVQDTVRMELLLQAPNGTIDSLNKKLITMGFAEEAEESLTSKQNHEYREKCLEYTSNTVPQGAGFSSMELSLEDAIGFSHIKTTRNKIRLRGPSNPLEAAYVGITHLDRSKCIKVERDSVNSVSFNAEPQDKCSSMLVASNLTIGQMSDVVQARNTTLMPKILGLPTLICLMFAPYAEIRTDKNKTSYTGALCGLGFDPMTRDPLCPDHDIEIEFDTQVTLEDICDLNAIRMGVNMLLQTKDESKANLIQYRKVLRDYIIKLLQKKRSPREPHSYHKIGQWNQIPSTMLLQPSVDSTADNPHVLPLHKPPSLVVQQNTAHF